MGNPTLDDILTVANQAASTAGPILMSHFGQLKQVRHKGPVDLVSEADLASEQAIVDIIRARFPSHSIIAEEGDYQTDANSKFRWVIDPLDGTTNYVHGLPLFAISIAFQIDSVTELGLVYNPAMDEKFLAMRGNGATLNGQSIQVSQVGDIAKSLLVTGFPYSHDEIFARSFDLFAALYAKCQGITW